ncbi:MAG: prepilin-type N-terminal cleavage/methylation domain-containing protein [Verrucomicrobia bacterium]|nr:prepilin-type N-terminal cleavage/methylation domain-containing protein [Verrucomicrobiota bacterium]
MKKQYYKNGYTLVELMITMVAASILILIVAMILVMAFQSWRINNAYADLRRDSALAFYMMARDVRESSYDGLDDTIDGSLEAVSAVNSNITTYTQNGDTLVCETGLVIPENVQAFRALKTNDGVRLTLELTNGVFGIVITNEVFVNTRN